MYDIDINILIRKKNKNNLRVVYIKYYYRHDVIAIITHV